MIPVVTANNLNDQFRSFIIDIPIKWMFLNRTLFIKYIPRLTSLFFLTSRVFVVGGCFGNSRGSAGTHHFPSTAHEFITVTAYGNEWMNCVNDC